MPAIFPKWTNRLPLVLALLSGGSAFGAAGFVWYYFSPKYTDVGYAPVQPVAYSHKLHAGTAGMDCRYCHTAVEQSAVANIPPTQTCMNCHAAIKPDTEAMLPVRESWASGKPIPWVRVHKLPDFVQFNHGAHLAAGVGCASCHGRIDRLEVVRQEKPLSMAWCLDCHRNPEPHLRPRDKITQMDWSPPSAEQSALGKRLRAEYKIDAPIDCSACHY